MRRAENLEGKSIVPAKQRIEKPMAKAEKRSNSLPKTSFSIIRQDKTIITAQQPMICADD